MKITFSDLKFRSQEDYEILNIGSIKDITFDTTTEICTITSENGVYKIPYTELCLDDCSCIACSICMKPHATALNEYIEIGISYNGEVMVFNYFSNYISEHFKKRCRPFLGMKQ